MLSVIADDVIIPFEEETETTTDSFESAAAQFDEVINFTYCTEFIVGRDAESLDYLRQKATELATMTIEPYAAIDDANFIAQLNNMMANGEMTADQVQSYLNSIGYDPVMGTETIDYTAFTIPGKSIPINVLGFDVGSIDIPDIEIQGKTQMPKIESVQSIGSGGYTPVSSTAKGNRPKVSGGGGGGGGGGGKKGGGGGGAVRWIHHRPGKPVRCSCE